MLYGNLVSSDLYNLGTGSSIRQGEGNYSLVAGLPGVDPVATDTNLENRH